MARWIPILVRAEDYEEIAALVVERETSRAAADPTTPAVDVVLPTPTPEPPTVSMLPSHADALKRQTPWSEEDLARLARGATRTTQRWARAIDVCADTPGKFLPTSEIAARSGMSINEWRDAPRKITRHLRAHYPDVPVYTEDPYLGEQIWPLVAKTQPGSTEVHWAITEEQARRWRNVRGASTAGSQDEHK